MTPLDFFLWGTVKEQVYATPIFTLEELQERITDSIHYVFTGTFTTCSEVFSQ
jgi:hypothetical protein